MRLSENNMTNNLKIESRYLININKSTVPRKAFDWFAR